MIQNTRLQCVSSRETLDPSNNGQLDGKSHFHSPPFRHEKCKRRQPKAVMGAESRHSSEGILVIREHNRRVCHKKQDKVLKLLSRPPEQNSRKCSFNSSDCLVKKCLYSFTIFPLFHKASQLSSFSPFAQGESADWTQDQMNISSMALPVVLLRSSAFLGCRSCDGGLQSRPPVQNRR